MSEPTSSSPEGSGNDNPRPRKSIKSSERKPRRAAWQDQPLDPGKLRLEPGKSSRATASPAALEFARSLSSLGDFDEVGDMARAADVAQRDFLFAVQNELKLTRDGMARRMCCSRGTLNKWTETPGSENWRQLPATMWKHLAEVIRYHLVVAQGTTND